MVAKAAHSTHAVLILGESGTRREPGRPLHPLLRTVPRQAVHSGRLRFPGSDADRKASCSATPRAPLLVRSTRKTACCQSPKGERFFWTKLASCRSTCRPSCCARSRERRSGLSAAPSTYPDQRTDPGRDQSRSGRRCVAGNLPQRLVLSPERAQPAHSVAARTPPGHSNPGNALS